MDQRLIHLHQLTSNGWIPRVRHLTGMVNLCMIQRTRRDKSNIRESIPVILSRVRPITLPPNEQTQHECIHRWMILPIRIVCSGILRGGGWHLHAIKAGIDFVSFGLDEGRGDWSPWIPRERKINSKRDLYGKESMMVQNDRSLWWTGEADDSPLRFTDEGRWLPAGWQFVSRHDKTVTLGK